MNSNFTFRKFYGKKEKGTSKNEQLTLESVSNKKGKRIYPKPLKF
jgi:hypothetical protein